MSRLIKGAVLLFLVIFSQNAIAQNYYNSPYTHYKVGDLINNGFATNRGMGGSSVALRTENHINYLNPASYTAQDTNSFLFMGGFTGRFVNIQTLEDSDQSNNINIEYLAIGFPIKKWLKMSAGLVPYSRIQYAFTARESESTGENTTYENNGFGGFNEFYIGAAVTIKEIVSIGANVNYLFGSLDRSKSTYLTDLQGYSASIEQKANYIASDFYTKIGLQFHPTIKEKHKLIVGMTLDARANINVKLKGQTTRYNTAESRKHFQDSLLFSIDTLAPMVLPNKIGIGFSYSYDDIITVTGEYIRQDWTGTNIEESNFEPGLYESIRFGAEYNPIPFSRKTRENYFKRMKYRVGAYYTKTYLYFDTENIDKKNIGDMGLTAGLSFPLKNSRNMFTGSAFNIGYQFGKRGTTDNGLIEENYHIVTVGFTLQDFWFLKPKYE